MKRDMDLIRKIMLQIEASPTLDEWIDVNVEGYSRNEILYHINLLSSADLITAEDISTMAGTDVRPTGLTWEGHQFVEAARDDGRWSKAKVILNKAGAWTLQFAMQVLMDIAQDQAKGLLGQGS